MCVSVCSCNFSSDGHSCIFQAFSLIWGLRYAGPDFFVVGFEPHAMPHRTAKTHKQNHTHICLSLPFYRNYLYHALYYQIALVVSLLSSTDLCVCFHFFLKSSVKKI